MIYRYLSASAILWLLLLLLLPTCDLGPGACGPFNSNPDACGPSPSTGTGGAINTTPNPTCAWTAWTPGDGFVWECNIPLEYAPTLMPAVSFAPCDVHLCAGSEGDAEAQALALMAARGAEPSSSGPAIVCSGSSSGPFLTWTAAISATPPTTPCVVSKPKETPCAELGETCQVTGSNPVACCAPNMCDVRVAPTVCCVPAGLSCDSDDQCCSTIIPETPSVPASDVCEDDGDGPACCHPEGALCNPNVTFGGCCESSSLICDLSNDGSTYICQ